MAPHYPEPPTLPGTGETRRVILRITRGARANQVQEFPVDQIHEIVLGRELGVEVRFDPDRDELVSRRHAKIVCDGHAGSKFLLVDLRSSNGTLLNGDPIPGQALLKPGDVIELGRGGPQLIFDLEPRSQAVLPETRLAAPSRPMSRVADPVDVRHIAGAVGPATVERMIVTATSQSRRHLQLVGLGIALLAFMGAIVFAIGYWKVKQSLAKSAADKPLGPAEIADQYYHSVVFIETAWTLVHTATGQEVYHHVENGKPAYVLKGDRFEPWLCLDARGAQHEKIGSKGWGTGFVVKEDGFILTNRHVAAGWLSAYSPKLPGVLCRDTSDSGRVCDIEIGEEYRSKIGTWIPAQARALGEFPEMEKAVDGKYVHLDVTFPKNTQRIPARLVRISDTHDVALLRIDLPETVRAVDLYDSYETIKPGEAVTVLGYPEISYDTHVLMPSSDAIDRTGKLLTIREPSLSTGVIGKIMRGSGKPSNDEGFRYFSDIGDVYQLTINTAGPGNSGGPVFDDRGRVIGIFAYSATRNNVTVTFAVPIRYGEELMSIAPVVR